MLSQREGWFVSSSGALGNMYACPRILLLSCSMIFIVIHTAANDGVLVNRRSGIPKSKHYDSGHLYKQWWVHTFGEQRVGFSTHT